MRGVEPFLNEILFLLMIIKRIAKTLTKQNKTEKDNLELQSCRYILQDC